MILFLDTETSGYWRDDLSPEDPRQPVVVQVAAVLENDAGRVVAALASMLTLEGWTRRVTMEDRVVEKHGITESMCRDLGQSPVIVLEYVRRLLSHSTRLVAHNVLFDVAALLGSFSAAGLPQPPIVDPYCTMNASEPILKMPPSERARRIGKLYKSPKLGEAYYYFTKRTFSGAHDALYDAMACRMVYKGIQRHLGEQGDGGPGHTED